MIWACLLVAACAGSPTTRVTVAIAAACDGYATALKGIARNYSHLSEAQKSAVDAVNEQVDTVCLPGSPVTVEALATVSGAVATINAYRMAADE